MTLQKDLQAVNRELKKLITKTNKLISEVSEIESKKAELKPAKSTTKKAPSEKHMIRLLSQQLSESISTSISSIKLYLLAQTSFQTQRSSHSNWQQTVLKSKQEGKNTLQTSWSARTAPTPRSHNSLKTNPARQNIS